MESSSQPVAPSSYPVTFSVDYPERQLNRLTTFFRIFTVIPIAILLALLPGGSIGSYDYGVAASTGTVIFVPIVLILLFRKKYPRWWYDWNLEFLRFGNRIGVYLALMDDEYTSTAEHQAAHLDFPYPNAERLERGLPLVKWLLAIPHYFVLFFLSIGAFFAVVFAWFAILVTGRCPRGLLEFVEGPTWWHHRPT